MLRITSLTLARGAKRLIENANLTIFPGHKVGLVGPNGCGKSTLFALLRGKMHQDAGDIYLPEKWVIAHVAQETPQSHRSALDYAMDGDVELRTVEKQLLDAETNHVAGEIIADLHVPNRVLRHCCLVWDLTRSGRNSRSPHSPVAGECV